MEWIVEEESPPNSYRVEDADRLEIAIDILICDSNKLRVEVNGMASAYYKGCLANVDQSPTLKKPLVNPKTFSCTSHVVNKKSYKKTLVKSCVGKEDVQRDHENNEKQQKWVCSSQDFRRNKWTNLLNCKKKSRLITGIEYLALIRVNLDRTDNTWVAKDFNLKHNHELASKMELLFMRSNRVVPELIGAKHREIEDDEEIDAKGALRYLECVGRPHLEFFETHTFDVENRLSYLFWAYGISRRYYACFGDIMAFDTTYNKNAYKKHLLIFVGSNHHYRTIVFALLYEDTEETYIWVLEEFLDCMKNKPPTIVLTDGDLAMANTIHKAMPTYVHCLCVWHLQNNVTINAPHPIFKSRFNELLYQYCTEEEIEDTWNSMVSEFEFEDS
ncbi:protein FAR1-RELATED SEQUENCE 4-like [Humulus lupulus]|uniref:protein FAR1-RELATED SEQUENCE 4-like n=1 Tax=Humulus lupulus TaxID=3486 RepID=UPI002B40388A|nr:protein FAR1-RELATED SEQUENCE 4-like [Humulus lupulus]